MSKLDRPHDSILERLFPFATAALGALSLFLAIYTQVANERTGTELVPLSLNSKRRADYGKDIPQRIPAERLDLVADVIFNQDPGADARGRLATVQANLLTPVAWIYTPTATAIRVSIPLPTATPGDPWVTLSLWRGWCRTEISLGPVSALKMRFHIIGGGGPDNRVSYHCCGSSGVSWLVNNTWLSPSDQAPWLNLGDSRESNNMGGGIVTRMRSNLGCNDNESTDVRIDYLPVTTPPSAPTNAQVTSSPTPTITPALAPLSLSTTIPQSPTRIPTLTPLPTKTAPR